MTASGSCLCGAVSYQVNGPLRDVVSCHCKQCRKTSGHFVAASSAARSDLVVTDKEAITWYVSSPGVRRGFCGTCGGHLFWDVEANDHVSIFAGTLDGETGLKTACHIFCADKGDYYEIDDGAPKYDGTWSGGG